MVQTGGAGHDNIDQTYLAPKVTPSTFTITHSATAANGHLLAISLQPPADAALVVDHGLLGRQFGFGVVAVSDEFDAIMLGESVTLNSGVLTVADDDSAASNGVQLYVEPLGITEARFIATLQSAVPTHFTDADGRKFYVYHEANPAHKGFPVFCRVNPGYPEEIIGANIPNFSDGLFVRGQDGGTILVFNATQGTSPYIYFDEDAADAALKMLAVQLADENGVGATIKFGDARSPEYVPTNKLRIDFYLDEDGSDKLVHENPQLQANFYLRAAGNRFLKIAYSATASSDGVPVYYNEDEDTLEFVSPTTSDASVLTATDIRPDEVIRA